jgi:peptidoglycan/LPS O-acetylase OafA/YrhL
MSPQPSPEAGANPHASYYPWFDLLRIALALGVFAAHADSAHWLSENWGDACVQVFFALSGFLIGGILLRTPLSALPRFYYNRMLRIWIPYAVALGLLLLVTVAKQSLKDAKLWETFFFMGTFCSNLFGPSAALYAARMPAWGAGGHFWSICVEEQFYLVAPLAMLLLGRWRVALLIGAVVLNLIWAHDFAAVALGMLLAIFHERFEGGWRKPVVQLAFAALLGCALVAPYVASFTNYERVAPFGAVATIALCARPGARSKLTAFLGGISYPFYLNHWLGVMLHPLLARVLHVADWLGLLAGLVLALGLSSVHYLVIDHNVQRWRGRWFTRRRGVLAFAVSVGLVAIGITVGLVLRAHPIP